MKKKIFAIVAISLILLGFVFLTLRFKTASQETISPRRGSIVEAIYALGKVKTRMHYELKLGILMTVQKVYVREGDPVKKGDPLAQFSDSGVFRSPFDGVVTLVAINEGESAAPSIPLLRVDDLSQKYVEVSLEQQGALRVRKGQAAEVVFESVRGVKLPGKVSALFSKNDEFLANIEVEGLGENVLPGMTADVSIIVGRHENALLIPAKAVSNGQVVVLRDKRKVKLPVTIGAIDGQMAEVTSDNLTEQDQIIVGAK